MKHVLIFCTLILCASILHAQQPPGPIKVGEEYPIQHATAHPYAAQGQAGVIFEQEFHQKHATYIKLYFEDFDLGPDDYIEISTHNTGESIVYAGKGKIVDPSGNMISDFWSMALMDDRVTVRLHSTGENTAHHGFSISRVAYGYPQAQLDALLGASEKSICGNDDKERVACYAGTEIANKSRAVCRLLINGTGYCTGWLLGDQGHVMTNNHCISNNSAAQNTDYQFNYQYTGCFGTSSGSTTTYSGATMIKTSSTYDYSLVQLASNASSAFGYLQISPIEPQVNDRIYIVGHPGGRRKEVSLNTDNGPAVVSNRHLNGILYYADTESGSSGSPVIDYNTHQVVALHNLGGCPNESQARSDKLISSIGADMPRYGIANSTGCGGFPISSFPYTESFESGLGHWFNETGDDSEWQRGASNTLTPLTGPTSAQHGDFYMHIESSDHPNYPGFPNKKSYLESRCFNFSNLNTAQMTFKYHMYGSTMGTMTLEYSLNGLHWYPLWDKSGDQGNSWKSATVNLDLLTTSSNVRLRFSGLTANGDRSDMAIDYVRITGTTTPTPTCTSSFPVTYGFESGFDGWTQSTADNFNWTRRTGSTPTGSTGPSSAYSGSWYLYIESSNASAGHVATMDLPCKLLSGEVDVKFNYHMYGSNTGYLQLLTRVNGGPWNTVFLESGNKGNSWQSATVSLGNLSYNTQVEFQLRASKGNGSASTSDIAVDNFRLLATGGGLGGGGFGGGGGGGFGESLDLGSNSATTQPPFFEATPNPFQNELNVRTNLEGAVQYRLTNLQGQTLQEGNLQRPTISVENIPTGVYFLTLFNEEERLVQKVVKQ